MTEHVKIEFADGVMTLTLQRPEKKNALTGAMYDALSDALKKAEGDASVRAVVCVRETGVDGQIIVGIRIHQAGRDRIEALGSLTVALLDLGTKLA